MKTLLIALSALFILCGCSHNQGTMIAGKGFILGGQGIQYFNGVVLLDNSRENSSWKIELTEDDDLQAALGKAKSIRCVERKVEKQITGYLVDLAEADAESSREYLKKAEATVSVKQETSDTNIVNSLIKDAKNVKSVIAPATNNTEKESVDNAAAKTEDK